MHSDYSDAVRKLCREQRRFDIIFMDPPYNKNFVQEALKLLTNNDIMKDDGIIIAEHSSSDDLPDAWQAQGSRLPGIRRYDDNHLQER